MARLPPAPAAPAPAAATADTSAVQALLLTVVSEKTGYPEDMLDLDMALDADLGIDSIKRVEILSAMQEAMPELPTVEAEDLGKLETLRDVIEQVSQSGSAPEAVQASSPAPISPPVEEKEDPLSRRVLNMNSVDLETG